jgi:hypothetical protein
MKDLIHEHKWKRGSEEKASTVKEIGRKARQIGPAYNKGALQYLPSAGLSDSTRLAGERRRAAGERQADETSARRDEETDSG